MFKRLLRNESGVTLVEYSLILGTVSLIAITMMTMIGTNLSATFNTIASKL